MKMGIGLDKLQSIGALTFVLNNSCWHYKPEKVAISSGSSHIIRDK